MLEEIEELSNPKLKAGKKALTQEQQQLKATVLNVLDGVRDESSKDALVRLVLEPKSSKTPQQEFINTLLAHTSLETSAPINLTMVGMDGRPTQKSLRQMLQEWLAFRQTTLTRRSQHQLDRVQARIHILEGRQVVLLHIDEVIAIIRESDEPKAALIARFDLSDRQAEDILEIRLRQLARLEAIKIDKELQQLREDEGRLLDILANPKSLQRLLIKEVERDAKTFADPRRTLIEEAQRVSTEIKVVDRAGDRGHLRKRLGACLEGPRPCAEQLQLQSGRCPVGPLCLPQRGYADCLWQPGPGVQRGRGHLAGWARRWGADSGLDRFGSRARTSSATLPGRRARVC